MRPKTFILTALTALGSAAAQQKQQESYPAHPDSERHQGVPSGRLIAATFDRSQIFPGTTRAYWVYVPAQYDPEVPAPLMVFQDGRNYMNRERGFRVPNVFDNLIAKGDMPVTIGVFVNPGWYADDIEGRQGWKAPEGVASNRSFEYDTLSGEYARFLEMELLAAIGKNHRISRDPRMRAICGMSSGGICAFTAAWQRPDLFGKVVSHIGSFTNIRGGHIYPAMIRKTERKPIRVFLQDGRDDLDNEHGNWWLANQQMEAALKFAGYDCMAVWGDGGHNGKHGGAVFPHTMRWLWRDWKKGS